MKSAYLCKNVPKFIFLVLTCEKIKNLETSEDFFEVQGWPSTPKTKSRVSDAFSQIRHRDRDIETET